MPLTLSVTCDLRTKSYTQLRRNAGEGWGGEGREGGNLITSMS
jgi:hypothetical protein